MVICVKLMSASTTAAEMINGSSNLCYLAKVIHMGRDEEILIDVEIYL